MKILVTGGNGMLATAIRNIYKNFDYDIRFCSRSELDITDKNSVIQFFNTERFECVINCAAYTFVEKAETEIEAAYAVNKIGVANLATAANSIGALLIHISTDAVYDGVKNSVYFETDPCNPLSVYSKSKYEGELEIGRLHNSAIIIRTSWLYSMDKPNFVTAILHKAKNIGELNVVFDQLGSPTYCYDLANAILAIVSSLKNRRNSGVSIYHYSNQGAISWYDFAVAICSITQTNAKITPVLSSQYPSSVIRPFHTIMSKEKIKNTYNLLIPYWRHSLEECLKLIST